MDETNERAAQPQRRSGVKRSVWVVWLFIVYVFDSLIDAVGENFRVIEREFQVFLGSTLFLIGLLSFESDKFCDGNTADYLSCTRPSTYYFYDSVAIALIVVGALLILAWYLKRRAAN